MAFQMIFLFHFVISTYYLTFKKMFIFDKKNPSRLLFWCRKKRIPSFYNNMSQNKEILKNN